MTVTKPETFFVKTEWFIYTFNIFAWIPNIPVNYPDDDRDSDRNMLVNE